LFVRYDQEASSCKAHHPIQRGEAISSITPSSNASWTLEQIQNDSLQFGMGPVEERTMAS
jgi:hypothetical protein